MAFHSVCQFESGLVKIANPASLTAKLTRMRQSKALALVTDYDQTLVKARLASGQKAANSFHALIHYDRTPSRIRTEAMQMFEHYYPME